MGDLALQRRNVTYSLSKPSTVIRNPQPIVQLKLAGQAIKLTSTATPTIASSLALSAALVNTFTTRWGVVFREYLMLKCVATIKAVGGNAGTSVVYMDEINASAPTATTAGQNTHILVSNAVGYNNSTAIASWRLAEINDAGWTATSSTAPVPVYLKVYSDTTVYGLAQASTDIFVVDFMVTFAFRGII